MDAVVTKLSSSRSSSRVSRSHRIHTAPSPQGARETAHMDSYSKDTAVSVDAPPSFASRAPRKRGTSSRAPDSLGARTRQAENPTTCLGRARLRPVRASTSARQWPRNAGRTIPQETWAKSAVLGRRRAPPATAAARSGGTGSGAGSSAGTRVAVGARPKGTRRLGIARLPRLLAHLPTARTFPWHLARAGGGAAATRWVAARRRGGGGGGAPWFLVGVGAAALA